jgi:import inner membrane translocase subunit TIM44
MSAYKALLTSTSRARLTTNVVRYQQKTTVRHYSSPFKVFMDTIKEQMAKGNEVKNLQDEAGRINDSEALKKAKEMFEKAKVNHYNMGCVCVFIYVHD